MRTTACKLYNNDTIDLDVFWEMASIIYNDPNLKNRMNITETNEVPVHIEESTYSGDYTVTFVFDEGNVVLEWPQDCFNFTKEEYMTI